MYPYLWHISTSGWNLKGIQDCLKLLSARPLNSPGCNLGSTAVPVLEISFPILAPKKEIEQHYHALLKIPR